MTKLILDFKSRIDFFNYNDSDVACRIGQLFIDLIDELRNCIMNDVTFTEKEINDFVFNDDLVDKVDREFNIDLVNDYPAIDEIRDLQHDIVNAVIELQSND